MSARKATGSVTSVAWTGSLGVETMSEPAGGEVEGGDCRRSGGRRRCGGLTEITKALKCHRRAPGDRSGPFKAGTTLGTSAGSSERFQPATQGKHPGQRGRRTSLGSVARLGACQHLGQPLKKHRGFFVRKQEQGTILAGSALPEAVKRLPV